MAVDLLKAFEERLSEVDTYLDFLKSLDESNKFGSPKLENSEQIITPQQQKILYASVYLQLYNLVESSITRCIDAVTTAATYSCSWQVRDLSLALREEWVRGMAQTHVELNASNRLVTTMALCAHLLNDKPVTKFSINAGGGGNWDDNEIEAISKRIGFKITVSDSVYKNIKRPVKDGKGALALIKQYRNELAHGSTSFTECASEASILEIIELKENIVSYLYEVVYHFIKYIENFEYLLPEKRPIIQHGEQKHH